MQEMTEYVFDEKKGTTCLVEPKTPARTLWQVLESAITRTLRYWAGYQKLSQD